MRLHDDLDPVRSRSLTAPTRRGTLPGAEQGSLPLERLDRRAVVVRAADIEPDAIVEMRTDLDLPVETDPHEIVESKRLVGGDQVQNPRAQRVDPHRDLERRNIQKRVDEEIKKLPVVFREVVVLRDVQELSYEEISEILKIPLGTVKSRVNRARLRLQKRLKDLL